MNLKDTTCAACLGTGELFDEDRQRWETCKRCEGLGFGLPADHDEDEEAVDYVALSYAPRCSTCGSRQLDDAGRCEVCHGDPYYFDEWYEDEDEGDGHYFTGTCEECFGTGYDARGAACEYCGGSGYDYGDENPTLPLPPVVDKRNPILRIVSAVVLFALRLFRIDPKDRIPF